MGHYDDARERHDKKIDDDYFKLHGITYSEECRKRRVIKKAKELEYLKECYRESLDKGWLST